jgi:hypothetical protein
MTAPFPFESKQSTAARDLAIVHATLVAICLAVAGTAAFSMLIALSHAIQGKDPSLGGTLIRAAPACGLLAILSIPAIALARRAAPDRIGTWRSMLTHAALGLTFAAVFIVLRALVDLGLGMPGSPNLADGVQYHFVRGFGVAVLVYATIVMTTWMIDRHRPPAVPRGDAPAESKPETGVPTTFVVRTGSRTYGVPLDRVDWIEAQGNYVALHADGRSHLVRHTMKSLSAALDQTFVRVERSALVRVSAIREVRSSGGSHLVILRDGSALKVSRRMREAVISAMANTA